jgi:hypothetical protein
MKECFFFMKIVTKGVMAFQILFIYMYTFFTPSHGREYNQIYHNKSILRG